MPLWKIAWRSIQRRSLASALTTFSMALGVMLVVAVLLIIGVVDASFQRNSSLGYDTVVGAKGGKLQLVLNTVFYLSQPVENLPFEFYEEFLTAEQRVKRNAVSNKDYLPQLEVKLDESWSLAPTPLVIPAGSTRLQVRVPLVKDDVAETAQEFSLRVVITSENTANDRAEGIATITREAGPELLSYHRPSPAPSPAGALPRLRITNPTAAESTDTHMVFEITLDGPATKDVAMTASLRDGRDGIYAEFVDKVVPVCLGDYFGNYRVVGTTNGLFDFMYDVDRQLKYKMTAGQGFLPAADFPHGDFQAVLGAKVARETGLKVGDSLKPTHGAEEGKAHDDFYVVGILASSGTPQDRAVFVSMDGFNGLQDHQREDGRTEVTSLLVDTKTTLHSMRLNSDLSEGPDAQGVLPIREIAMLFTEIVRPLRSLLLLITGLICIISGVSILVSIYNSMSDRKHEIAVIRSLGAGRTTVMTIVLLESVILALAGGCLGWIAGHGLIGLASGRIEDRTGVAVSAFQLAPPLDLSLVLGQRLNPGISAELWLVPGLIVLAIVVGFLPALSAYRTDVAKALQSSP